VLSTYLTINRQLLSVSDVLFTTFLTVLSPIGVYFGFSTLADIWRNWRKALTRQDLPKIPVRVFTMLLPVLVFLLQVVAAFPNSFFDSRCSTIIFDQSYSDITDAAVVLFIFFSTLLAWTIGPLYLFRHFRDINAEARRRRAMKSRTWFWFGWVQASFRFMKSWIASAWYVLFQMVNFPLN